MIHKEVRVRKFSAEELQETATGTARIIVQCLIESHSEIEDVRNLLKERYNLEFSEHGTSSHGTRYVKFSNITDDRDITLVIERVDILNVKSSDN